MQITPFYGAGVLAESLVVVGNNLKIIKTIRQITAFQLTVY